MSKENKKSALIIISSHIKDKGTIDLYHSISKSVPSNYDVLFVFDNNGKILPKSLENLNLHTFNGKNINSLGYSNGNGSILPGRNHLIVIDLAMQLKKYDFIWNIEYDVRFKGDWSKFFAEFENDNTDFLTTHVRDYSESNSDWPHWKMNHPVTEIKIKQQTLSFNPLYRLSFKACTFLDSAMRDGWRGHHETLIPTLLKLNDFSIADIGGDGPFTPERYKNKMYQYGKNGQSTFRFRPSYFTLAFKTSNLLYHPVKPLFMVLLEKTKSVIYFIWPKHMFEH